MSRIGRKPIAVPKGVTVTVKKDVLEFKGPKGAMKQGVPPGISFEMSGTDLVAKNIGDDPNSSKYHGLARSLMANAVLGVTEGFKRELDIVGVGYRAEVKGKQVVFALGIASGGVRHHGRDRRGDRQADESDRSGRGSPAGWTGGREHPRPTYAGSVQAKGCEVYR